MSMTSLLRSSSYTKKFLKTNLPLAEKLIKCINADLDTLPYIDVLPAETPGHIYGWVGTAFDYRARYYLKVTPYSGLMAHGGGKEFASNKQFGVNLNRWMRKAVRGKSLLSDSTERKVCLLCLLLAKLEVLGRSSMWASGAELIGGGHYKVISNALSNGNIESILKLLEKSYPKEVVEDLMGLSREFQKNVSSWKIDWVCLNPIFPGSGDVGGADADLIVNSTLIEIKCKKRKLSINDLFQVIGYKLLDYNDSYGIEMVALYLGRWGKLEVFDFKKLILGLGSPYKIRDFRKNFRQAIAKDVPTNDFGF